MASVRVRIVHERVEALPELERSDGSSILIDALVPLTRPGWVEAGEQLLAGMRVAVREVNDTGGILGRPLELVVRDTAADPEKAAAAVDELARLGASAAHLYRSGAV